MSTVLRLLFSGKDAGRRDMTALFLLLVVGNLVAWCWALVLFHGSSLLLATAGLAYGFGLRHGLDADHIAAIDNAVRKLMHEGKRPTAAGVFFALGHSTLVVLVASAIALSAMKFYRNGAGLIEFGGSIGMAISASLLLAIGGLNLAAFSGVWQALRRARRGDAYDETNLNLLLARRGVLARVLRGAFALVGRSWHMYLLGIAFAFGFDTATEIGILGISASQGASGLSIAGILAFPILFAAGMTLVDGCDGMLMIEAYGWVFLDPLRKLYYNLAITGISIVLALVIGGAEAFGLLVRHFGLEGSAWAAVSAAANQTGMLGYFAFGAVAALWLGRLLARDMPVRRTRQRPTNL